MGATFNTGYLENLILYNGSNNIGIGTSADATYKVTLGGSLLGTSALFSSSLTATQGKFSGSRPQGIFTENGTSGLYLRDATGSSYKSWSIGTNDIVVGFAITPSTAAGGTTFTTPAFVINESGNVGIGLTNPAAADFSKQSLDASGPIIARGSLFDHQTSATVMQYYNGESWIRAYGATVGSGILVFRTGGGGGSGDSERLRITSGGDVLISTSTSATNPNGFARVLNVRNTDAALVLSNTSGTAKDWSIGAFTGGYLGFFDGTSERMRITSGGATIMYNNMAVVNGQEIYDTQSFAAGTGGTINFGGKYNTAGTYTVYGRISARKENGTDGNTAGYLLFATSSNGVSATERMRIDSAGRLVFYPANISNLNNSIYSNTNGYMYVEGNTNGLIIHNNSGGDCRIRLEDENTMRFETSGSERMRITSGGKVNITNSLTDYGFTAVNSNAGGYGAYIQGGSSSSTTALDVYASNGTTRFFTIRGDGLIAFPKINDFTTGNSPNTWINPSSSWGIYINTSSIRYKRDVVNYDKGIDVVSQMRPVYYKGKSVVDGDKLFAGFIAEEIHELGLTEFVQYNNDGEPNSLAYPNITAILVKAVQELKAEIEILKNK